MCIYMYVYMHMYIHIYTHIHICIHIYICVCIHTYIHTYTYVCIYIFFRERDWHYMIPCDSRRAALFWISGILIIISFVNILYSVYHITCICIYTYIYMYIYIYIYIYMYVYIHMHVIWYTEYNIFTNDIMISIPLIQNKAALRESHGIM